MMRLVDCDCRHEIEGVQTFLCSHPKVFARDNVATPAICRSCAYAGDIVPLNQRKPIEFHANPFLNLNTVSVIIPCHNYGAYLAEAIESVLTQTFPAQEIIVVLDRCTDSSFEVADRYRDQGVMTISVDFGNVHCTRRKGFQESLGSVVCFLDADDWIGPEYLKSGLKKFDEEDVGIVYSDLYLFGNKAGVKDFPETFSRHNLFRQNFIHAGSLVRRDALELSSGFLQELDAVTASCTADWWLWKCLVKAGWTAKKQDGQYHYRQHSTSALTTQSRKLTYSQAAWLEYETLTLCLPLSGRESLWGQMQNFLEQQSWPHDQIQLLIIDTSQNPEFSKRVQAWLAESDYSDYRYINKLVGSSGLADVDRLKNVFDVRKAMAKIYNLLKTELTTDFVWILEDDILPPQDVVQHLINEFDERTVSVAAPYLSRFQESYVAWNSDLSSIRDAPEGVTRVGGNGFGCVILRSEVIHKTSFSHHLRIPDFDRAFYRSLGMTEAISKVNWDVECQHVHVGKSDSFSEQNIVECQGNRK